MQFDYAATIRRRLARLAAKPKRHDLERHHADILRHMRDHGITGDDAFLVAAQSLGIGARPSPRPRAEMGPYEARVSYLRSAPPERRRRCSGRWSLAELRPPTE